MADKIDFRLIRRLSVALHFDCNQMVNYLKIPSFQRSEQTLEYIRNLIGRMKVVNDVHHLFHENFQKELAMYFKVLYKAKNEIIASNFDIFLVLSGEVTASSESKTFKIFEGGYFGEPCLLYPKIAQYKLICSQPCTFAYMSYQQFLLVSSRYTMAHLEQSANDLKQIPQFKDYIRKQLLYLSSCFKLISIDRHSCLFSEGDECEYVYIIKTGELEITKSVHLDPIKTTNYNKNGRPINLPDIKSKAKVPCLIKSKLEMIGDEEAVNDLKWRFTCTCHSFVCVLYRISKADYKKNFRNEEHPELWKEKDLLVKSHLQKSIGVLKKNQRSSSLPLPPNDLKRKVLSTLNSIDPWGYKKNLIISTRNCLVKEKKHGNDEKRRNGGQSCLNLYSNVKCKDLF
jgi:CRP-like cAMP-binding protein